MTAPLTGTTPTFCLQLLSAFRKHRFNSPISVLKRGMASTFQLPESDPACQVKLPDGLAREKFLAFRPFKQWLSTLQASIASQSNKTHPFHKDPYKLRTIEVQAVDWFGDRIGFLKLRAEVTNANNGWLPGAVFLRGASVAMLIVLQAEDQPSDNDDHKYVLLTLQPRIAAGSLGFTEIPAGMLDDGTFAGAAAKEIEEECGIKVPESELIDLTALALSDEATTESGSEVKLGQGMYPSPGACDEYIPIFLHEKKVPRQQLEDWQGKLTGLREEGEKITLKVVKLKDLWREGARDGKTLSALALYTSLKAIGKI